ncbi:protein phosphatase 2C domain-containing protein [Verrucosispora sp. WMMC514]|uniref:protein phosphatase 2C domain-containing protein n=1 Tax=Verrucosispora sp. WMMC514 TaxID=3015156 RepID=UPI00248C726B|nr:protein phosphatase 2C domain-containing protein [Verrucosispora sp. WMMC514]WBB93380.1 protein phosphatase 2C domain-containing protein [Verrucosispora sp. WMMC514]
MLRPIIWIIGFLLGGFGLLFGNTFFIAESAIPLSYVLTADMLVVGVLGGLLLRSRRRRASSAASRHPRPRVASGVNPLRLRSPKWRRRQKQRSEADQRVESLALSEPPPDTSQQDPSSLQHEVPPAAQAHSPAMVTPLIVGPTDQTSWVRPPLPSMVITGTQENSSFFSGVVAELGWEVRGASLRGLTHAEVGESGQDALGVRWTPERDGLLLAVADGVGSKRDSREAARRAIVQALRLTHARPGIPLEHQIESLAKDLGAWLKQQRYSAATTLVLAELTDAADGLRLRIAAVGDSEVWCLADGTWKCLYHRRTGGETEALPRYARAMCREYRLSRGAVVVLATDGFAAALDGRSRLATELAVRWATAPTELSFVNDVAFHHDHHLDDRTVLAVWTGER